MSKIKLLSIAVIVLIIINLTLIAYIFLQKPSHPADGLPPDSRRRPAELIIKQLHFDNDQVKQYESLIDIHRSTIKKLDDSISITKNELYITLDSEDSQTNDSLITRLANLQEQIERVHYDHFADIKKICRPDQIGYYNELISKLADYFNPKKSLPPPPKD